MVVNGVTFPLGVMNRLCREAGVRGLYLIGSILSDRFVSDSDIDLLVETDPAHPTGLLRLGGLQMDLADLLRRPVHLTLLGGVPASARPALIEKARRLIAA